MTAVPAALPVHELWAELGASMRMLRRSAGTSLRRAELESGRGRGMLSQIETGKARPARDLVEWYDSAFGGDGLLLAMYAEARGAHGPSAIVRAPARAVPGDAVTVEAHAPAAGTLVTPGAGVTACWTLANSGTVAWRGRVVQRVGAHAAVRLIASDPAQALPDCEPGERVEVRVPISVPASAGTFAAYWHVADADGHTCFAEPPLLAVVLVVSGDH